MAKSGFPDSAPNNQLARYLFYLGRIKAVQLECAHLPPPVARAPPPPPFPLA